MELQTGEPYLCAGEHHGADPHGSDVKEMSTSEVAQLMVTHRNSEFSQDISSKYKDLMLKI